MADQYSQDGEPLDIFGSDPFGRNYLYGLSGRGDGLGLQPPIQGLPVDTRPYDRMQATPRGFISGLFSDVLGGALNMPNLQMTGVPALDLLYANRKPLMNFMGVGDVQKTAERISYGEPLTTGSGMTLRPRDETIGAALTVAPFVGEAASFGARAGRAGARMVGERMAENVAMGRPNLPSMFAEPRSSLFAVEPSPMAAPKPQAPVSELGFYSAAEQAALNLPRNKGTGQSFLNDLMKSPDVKKDELAWTGLDDFLKDKPNVTKQEVQDFIANNKVDLQEVRLGEPFTEDPVGVSKRLAIFDRYEPEIQALYKEMDNPRYRLVNRGMGAEEYNRGVVLQNRGFRGEPLTAQEQSELDGILSRLDGNTVKEFANAEEARAVYLAMSPEEKLQHSIRPVKSSTELQQEINLLQVRRDAEANRAYVIPEPAPAKYKKYQLAGGENYREILLKLPQKETRTPNMIEYEKLGQQMFGGALNPAERARLDELENLLSREERSMALSGGKSKTSVYQSSHFDEPNILAHIRVNDRVDADGKKMLLVEEIQSDWHQAGREKGYKGKGTLKELPDNYFVQEVKTIDGDTMYVVRDSSNPSVIINKDYNRQSAINGVINELNASSAGGVPDAPFKDTWYQLALKRVMKYAADNGYERVGLTTGKQQASRFDLSKQVDEIAVPMVNEDGSRSVRIDPTEGTSIKLMVDAKGVVTGYGGGSTQFSGKKLSEVIGKDIADKVMQANANAKFTGLDLSVGGEGMKKYYDEIYPKFLEKYGKKWDAGVGETKIITEDNAWNMAEQIKQRGISDAQWRALSEEDKLKLWNDIKQSVGRKQEPIRYIDITPKMKESVGKGQPLFTTIPAGTLGLGGLEYADPFASPLAEDTTR
jgi:hypothetical protein